MLSSTTHIRTRVRNTTRTTKEGRRLRPCLLFGTAAVEEGPFFVLPSGIQAFRQATFLLYSQGLAFLQPSLFFGGRCQGFLFFGQGGLQGFRLGLQGRPRPRQVLQSRQAFLLQVAPDDFEAGTGPAATAANQRFHAGRTHGDLVRDDLFAQPRIVVAKDEFDEAGNGPHQELLFQGRFRRADPGIFLSNKQ